MLPPPIAAIAEGNKGGQPEVPPQMQMQMQQMGQQLQQLQQALQQAQGELAKAKGTLDQKQLENQRAAQDLQARAAELQATERIRGLELEIAREKARAEELRLALERDRMLREQAAEGMEQANEDADDMAEKQALAQIAAIVQQTAQKVESISAAVANLTGPRTILRGPDGLPLGVRYQDGSEHHLVPGEDGNPTGIAPANLQ